MDPFDLDLNPAMNSGIFYHETYSSNSLNFSEQEEFPNFDKQNNEENFSMNFNKVFHVNSPDIKDDSISEEDNIYDKNNIDEFIIRFQNENLNNYYFKKDFDGIINQIEKQFPFFFNDKNTELLYLIEKLRFFHLLKEKKYEEAKKFYQDKLIILIKEIKKQNWEIKSKFFTKLLKKPILIEKQGDLQKKYYDQFTFGLEKAIRTFLHEENDELNKNDFLTNSNHNFNCFVSSSSLELDNFPKFNSNKEDKIKKKNINKNSSKEKETDDGDNIINEDKLHNNEESDEFDLADYSTKEEFSDFEDELQPKISNDHENQKNINKIETSESNIKINKFMNDDVDDSELDPVNNNSPFFSNFTSLSKSHKSSYDIIPKKEEEEENEFIIDTSSKKNKDNFIENENKINENKMNNNLYENLTNFKKLNINENTNTKNNKRKNNKKGRGNKNEEIIFNQLPFLNSFKPKYIKRETIDKKIIRTFKNYVVKENKAKRLEINEAKMDRVFFINLIYGNLSPPIDFVDGTTGEVVKFNSFNCNFLLWFFSKKGVKDVYLQFINEKGKEFINQLSEHYEISPDEKNQLNNYISNYPFIFDISIVNNITNGGEINHLYRTVEKNKKIQNEKRRKRDNDLDLKRYDSNSSDEGRRERSRSKDFNIDI